MKQILAKILSVFLSLKSLICRLCRKARSDQTNIHIGLDLNGDSIDDITVECATNMVEKGTNDDTKSTSVSK